MKHQKQHGGGADQRAGACKQRCAASRESIGKRAQQKSSRRRQQTQRDSDCQPPGAHRGGHGGKVLPGQLRGGKMQ